MSVESILTEMLKRDTARPRLISPTDVTLGNYASCIFPITPMKQGTRRPCYWVGVRLTSKGTANNVYIGTSTKQTATLLVNANDYIEFSVEHKLIDGNEIFAYADNASTTTTILVTGYEQDTSGMDSGSRASCTTCQGS